MDKERIAWQVVYRKTPEQLDEMLKDLRLLLKNGEMLDKRPVIQAIKDLESLIKLKEKKVISL